MLSVLISTHMLLAARKHGVERFFYSSSACIYPAYKQTNTDVTALKESDAYPADCEDGYGWEKLFTERLCRHFARISGSKPAWRAITTFTAPMELGMAGGKRRRPRCRARWRWR